MSMRLNALYNERATVWERMKDIRSAAEKNEGQTLTAEQRTNWDAAEARMKELSADIEREQRASEYDALEKGAAFRPDLSERSRGSEEQAGEVSPEKKKTDEKRSHGDSYTDAYTAYLRRGREDMTSEQRKVLGSGYYEERALSVGTNTAGGYTIPPAFREAIIETMKAFGSVRTVAETINTQSGQDMTWPTHSGITQVGRIIAENTQVTQTDPVFGTASLSVYMYSSDAVLVPYQFLEDTFLDVNAYLGAMLGERVARIQNQHFTTGTGTAQPLGIVTGATAGVTLATGNTTSITYAGLVNLIHSIDPAYRNANSAFMMSDTALAAFRLLLDTTNRPIWEPSLQAGAADRLLGYPIVINQDMAAPAANVKSVLFGDFRAAYIVRDVVDMQVKRLDERYADYLQVGFIGFARSGATVKSTNAYKALVQSAT